VPNGACRPSCGSNEQISTVPNSSADCRIGGSGYCCVPKTSTKINGACKTYPNGVNDTTTKNSDWCTAGTVYWTDVAGTDGVYNWRCDGANGGTNATCSAKRIINGRCATGLTSAPTSAACLSGTFKDMPDFEGHWIWDCVGVNGGTTAHCNVASVPVSYLMAKCAPFRVEDNLVFGDDLCIEGSPSEFKTTPQGWEWKCGGAGYKTAACSAEKSTDTNRPRYCYGSCLTRDVCNARGGQVLPLGNYTSYSNCDDAEICCVNISLGPAKCGVSFVEVGKTLVAGDDLCEVGDYKDFRTNGDIGWTWKCVTSQSTKECSAPRGMYGTQCANKKDDAFCALSSQCTGTNFGQVDCENGKICCWGTTVKIDGVCGTGRLSCQSGTVDDGAVADTGDYYRWACRGIHGGSDVTNCAYKKPVPVVPMLILSATKISLYPGETHQITATLKPETAKVNSWTSNNNGVATASRKTDKVGVIRAVTPGTTDVVVRASNGKTAAVRVIVNKRPQPTVVVPTVRLTPIPTIRPTVVPTGTSPVPTLKPTSPVSLNCTNPTGKNNDKLCFVNTNEIKTCVNGTWSNPVACQYGCSAGSRMCNGAPTDKEVNFKITFDGVRPNAECISVLDLVDVEVANVPTNKYQGDLSSGFSLVNGEVDSRDNQVFQVNNLVLDPNTFKGVNKFNYIRVKGPFHLKRRMCQDNQNGKIPEHVKCDISLDNSDKVYNFKNYTLLAGDVVKDGVINTADRSFVKTRFNPSAEVLCGREGDLNLDGVVNSIDMDLVKYSLSEIDDE